jgi:uncharacterized radical SAM superfamily Fe-S cluster-containing enzyme
MKVRLSSTESVCPVCLRRVAADRVAEGDNVYLHKTCPDHGHFRTILWRGLPSYEAWAVRNKPPSRPPVCSTSVARGCPFDCGLCPDHRQHTCCVVMEVTTRCNLTCPYCFAAAGGCRPEPGLREIESWCRTLLASGGPFNLQISGGEPTVRNDLPEVIQLARALGFNFIQLNTNGIRLAEGGEFAGRLKRAGLDCVFLQFDGLTDDVYRRIRGRALLQTKLDAIRHCAEHELGVVLVPTLVPQVNTTQIGDIIRFAMARMPAVRAVHFQPVSYVGRHPKGPLDEDRITIPEVLREIERQTEGRIPAAEFHPGTGENAYCSFHGKFVVHGGEIRTSSRLQTSGCCGPNAPLVQLGNGEGARRARRFVARHWTFPEELPAGANGFNTDSLDAFLAEERDSFCISGMAFQDAWNLDLDRLRECYIHAVGPNQGLYPLCAYNLTDTEGRALYRGVWEERHV